MTELVVRPWAGGYALEATLDDGTDRVVLAFVGRREIEGLRIGQELAASGTIGPASRSPPDHEPVGAAELLSRLSTASTTRA